MIDWFRSWSKGIIIAVIISSIIEMILPDNTSKKYIKIIIGIFIVYTIISPVIENFAGKDINEYIKIDDTIETSSYYNESDHITDITDSSIKKIYMQNLENDIKAKLKTQGYIANNVKIQISNDDSYNIEKLDIEINEKIENNNNHQVRTIVDNIKSIKIKIENKQVDSNAIINENDKNEIKKYIKSVYEIDENKVNVY